MHGHPFQWGAVAAPAAPAVVELIVLCILVVALALLQFAAQLAGVIRDLLNFEVPVVHKTVRLGSTIVDPVIHALDDAAQATSGAIAGLWADVRDAVHKALQLSKLVANGLHSFADLLWNSKLADILVPPFGLVAGAVHLAYNLAHSAWAALYDPAVQMPDKIASYVGTQTRAAISAAQTYTNTAVGGVSHDLTVAQRDLTRAIGTAKNDAQSYADRAVSALGAAEAATIADVRSIATAAKNAAENAVSAAAGTLTAAEAYTDRLVADARSALSGAISSAEGTAEHAAAAALSGALSGVNAAIADARNAATSAVNAAAGGLSAAEAYADAEIASAIAGARADAAAALHDAVATVEGDLAAGLREAETVATNPIQAVRDAIAALRTATADEIAAAEALAASATAGAAGAATAAIETVKSIAIGAEHEIQDLTGPMGLVGAAAAIASIPAIATLVHAIADEAGLGRSECRGKVKDICRTDPAAWANLLGGIAAIGFALDFRQMVRFANSLGHEGADIIKKAA